MRIANLSGRLVIVTGSLAVDVETASYGAFGSDPQAVFDRWHEFVGWAAVADLTSATPFDQAHLYAPMPCPRQLFAIGLNYREHSAELGLIDEAPIVFTKFASSITGPYADVEHPGGELDWEVELVVVISRRARRVSEASAWDYVAGLTVGQDVSERMTQYAGLLPQYSLGKSFAGFAPMGPWIVTPDELVDPTDLALECRVNGSVVQNGRTSEMIMSVASLIAWLSETVTLYPGDLIFTGTPAGVGFGMSPPQFLSVGDELLTRIEGIGELRNRIVAGPLPD